MVISGLVVLLLALRAVATDREVYEVAYILSDSAAAHWAPTLGRSARKATGCPPRR